MLETETVAAQRVLLVDDREDNLLALKAVLEPLDLELVTASSGAEALRCLLTREFDAIILDVQMPEMDGFETAALLKSRAATRNIPIVFLTAISHDLEHQLRGYEAGAIDYISKPFEPNVLRAKVQALVEMSAELRELERVAELYRESLAVIDEVGFGVGWGAVSLEREAPEAQVDDDSDGDGFVRLARVLNVELQADLRAPCAARSAIRAALAKQPCEVADTTVLLVSELVANAVVHARSSTAIRLDLGQTMLRCEVADIAGQAPRPQPLAHAGEGGRGLRLVRQLADRCGWTKLGTGKVTWFEIDLPPVSSSTLEAVNE